MYTEKSSQLLMIAIISFFVLSIFTINVGYGKISEYNLNESVSNLGSEFQINFSNPSVVKAVGVNKSETYIKISPNGNSLRVNVSDLQYPGAGAEFSVDIVNNGKLPAKLDTITVNGLDNSKAIKVEVIDSYNLKDIILNPEEKINIHFTVKWDKNYTENINEISNFNLKLNYVQAL